MKENRQHYFGGIWNSERNIVIKNKDEYTFFRVHRGFLLVYSFVIILFFCVGDISQICPERQTSISVYLQMAVVCPAVRVAYMLASGAHTT